MLYIRLEGTWGIPLYNSTGHSRAHTPCYSKGSFVSRPTSRAGNENDKAGLSEHLGGGGSPRPPPQAAAQTWGSGERAPSSPRPGALRKRPSPLRRRLPHRPQGWAPPPAPRGPHSRAPCGPPAGASRAHRAASAASAFCCPCVPSAGPARLAPQPRWSRPQAGAAVSSPPSPPARMLFFFFLFKEIEPSPTSGVDNAAPGGLQARAGDTDHREPAVPSLLTAELHSEGGTAAGGHLRWTRGDLGPRSP